MSCSWTPATMLSYHKHKPYLLFQDPEPTCGKAWLPNRRQAPRRQDRPDQARRRQGFQLPVHLEEELQTIWNCPSSQSARVARHVTAFSDENGRKKNRSDPFQFLLCYVHFRICGIPFPYLRKRERDFSVRFYGIPFSSGFDPYLFRFLSHFQSMWDMSRIWYVHKPANR